MRGREEALSLSHDSPHLVPSRPPDKDEVLWMEPIEFELAAPPAAMPERHYLVQKEIALLFSVSVVTIPGIISSELFRRSALQGDSQPPSLIRHEGSSAGTSKRTPSRGLQKYQTKSTICTGSKSSFFWTHAWKVCQGMSNMKPPVAFPCQKRWRSDGQHQAWTSRSTAAG